MNTKTIRARYKDGTEGTITIKVIGVSFDNETAGNVDQKIETLGITEESDFYLLKQQGSRTTVIKMGEEEAQKWVIESFMKEDVPNGGIAIMVEVPQDESEEPGELLGSWPRTLSYQGEIIEFVDRLYRNDKAEYWLYRDGLPEDYPESDKIRVDESYADSLLRGLR